MSEFAQGPGPEQAGHGPEQDTHEPGTAGARERPGQARPGQARPGQARPGDEQAHPEQAHPDQAQAHPDGEQERQSGQEPEEGPVPLGVGVRPTGHGPVDARLHRLEDADHLAVSGHLEVYEDVHRGLRETLAALDRPHTPRS
ncbi:hypothetical protein [Streptomyces iconiensis]|uniref:Uncharacterized protein n=1 Tax=Streptomyces iconiensis TaxID=1384038 RepID=A0ABT7A5V8_9ACTN|nr:hypothetical protein [Streptomyces iconiensis]MDJ1136729.1 hypothetical protein [Streptomyces iconiensis]